MKTAKSRIRISAHPALTLALAFIFTAMNSHAFLGFGGGEKARILKEADAAYAEGVKAYQENRAGEAYASFEQARSGYAELRREYPKYNTDHVVNHFKSSDTYFELVLFKVRSGQMKVDMPDEKEPAKAPPPDDAKSAAAKRPANAQAPAQEPLPVMEIIEWRPPLPSGVVVGSPPGVTVGSAAKAAVASENARLSNAARIRFIENLLTQGNISDAVFAAEDFVESDEEEEIFSEIPRILLIRSLMEAGNYKRASAELDELTAIVSPPTPAMRSLASALAFQKGDYIKASLEMDKLLEDNPGYADAHVNIAYCHYMNNPAIYTRIAILSYRMGIAGGAKRDLMFEEALEIELD